MQTIHTMDNLWKRRHVTVSGCTLCLEETANHVLIHYHFSSKVWIVILQRFGINWVMPRTIKDLFDKLEVKKKFESVKDFVESIFVGWFMEYMD